MEPTAVSKDAYRTWLKEAEQSLTQAQDRIDTLDTIDKMKEKIIVQHEERIKVLEKALSNIKRHMEVALDNGHKMTAPWVIANTALNQKGGEAI